MHASAQQQSSGTEGGERAEGAQRRQRRSARATEAALELAPSPGTELQHVVAANAPRVIKPGEQTPDFCLGICVRSWAWDRRAAHCFPGLSSARPGRMARAMATQAVTGAALGVGRARVHSACRQRHCPAVSAAPASLTALHLRRCVAQTWRSAARRFARMLSRRTSHLPPCAVAVVCSSLCAPSHALLDDKARRLVDNNLVYEEARPGRVQQITSWTCCMTRCLAPASPRSFSQCGAMRWAWTAPPA